MASLRKRLQLLLARIIPRQTDRAEDPVRTVNRRRPEHLADNRQHPLPFLAKTLRKELLHPVAESGQPRRKKKGELVTSLHRKLPEERSEESPAHLLVVAIKFSFCSRSSPFQQKTDIHPEQRRRYEAEAGENRIATADIRIVEEGMAEMVRAGEIGQGAPGIGDREKVSPRLLRPKLLRYKVVKILHE